MLYLCVILGTGKVLIHAQLVRSLVAAPTCVCLGAGKDAAARQADQRRRKLEEEAELRAHVKQIK